MSTKSLERIRISGEGVEGGLSGHGPGVCTGHSVKVKKHNQLQGPHLHAAHDLVCQTHQTQDLAKKSTGCYS